VRAIVIVIADLYWHPELAPELELTAQLAALPGLTVARRYGEVSRLEDDWRQWLAHWSHPGARPSEAPGTVAAAALGPVLATDAGAARQAWIATPVHLTAGLTSLHLDRRGLLRLPEDELRHLAEDFRGVLGESAFSLHALPHGDFLLLGPALAAVRTIEPARAVGHPLAQSRPSGEGAAALRRLQGEIEMWLHGHPVNQARLRRGAAPVSALWPWGGGPVRPEWQPSGGSSGDVAFASDTYTWGLLRLKGAQSRPLPDTLADVLGYAPAQRAAVIVELAQVLQTHPTWTLVETLTAIDGRFLAPAVQAVRAGSLASLAIIANDRCLHIRPRDLRRWWRRPRPALQGLLQ
jgi:hypothetical protein